MSESERLKAEAANAAVQFVKNNMVVGLGSGSTATYAIKFLSERIAQGLNILAIPSSVQSRKLAEENNIKLTSFAEHRDIDLTIDGADQVELKTLNLVKGLGNALLGEKLIARASKKFLIIVDESKLVECLGDKTALPVEIVPFGWELTKEIVAQHGCTVELKLDENKEPLITDGGHYTLLCKFEKIENARKLDKDLKLITGVVETGLFVNMADSVLVAKQNGVVTLQRE